MNIDEKINEMGTIYKGNGASQEAIQQAEQELATAFSEEYKAYLTKFGMVELEGHEITGIGKIKRLDVIDVTKKKRKLFPDIPTELYVVEDLNIDGAVAWQGKDGAIYISAEGKSFKKEYNSLVDYLSADE